MTDTFEKIQSIAMPLPIRDVDTDMIIPASFLTSVSREGYGENVFSRLRKDDPEFPFNLERFKDAQIMVVDDNFGCGSSREHAVWALQSWGIRAIIGKSFADIFSSNSAKNGLLCISIEEAIVDELLTQAAESDVVLGVDLEAQTVDLPDGRSASFDYDPFRKHCIVNGLDDIDYICSHKERIDSYRSEREQYRYFHSTKANHS